jgi:hypothetical protein
MKTDVKGCSTTEAGTEHYESFEYRHKKFIQYDYRHTDGRLFSCIGNTLKQCRETKNLWLSQQTPINN